MGTHASQVEKVTVSLPRRLVQFADQRAAELGVSRSQIVGRALADLEARERDELAREGYVFYASESEEFAASSMKAVSEALADAG
jgi:metal-responsive CopG/Arc/MetJ family transcriptional regulator